MVIPAALVVVTVTLIIVTRSNVKAFPCTHAVAKGKSHFEVLALLDSLIKALAALLEEKRLAQSGSYNYGNLVAAYINLNRLPEARLEVAQARARKLEPLDGYIYLYIVDFLEGNTSGMQAGLAWATGRPGVEDIFFNMQSDTEAYSGHRGEALALSNRAVEGARGAGNSETAAIYQVNAALREAEFGNPARALEEANSAITMAPSRNVKTLAALALARAGFTERAARLANELANAILRIRF